VEPARQASRINANQFMGTLPPLHGCFFGERAWPRTDHIR
jgi:hypothetical protein